MAFCSVGALLVLFGVVLVLLEVLLTLLADDEGGDDSCLSNEAHGSSVSSLLGEVVIGSARAGEAFIVGRSNSKRNFRRATSSSSSSVATSGLFETEVMLPLDVGARNIGRRFTVQASPSKQAAIRISSEKVLCIILSLKPRDIVLKEITEERRGEERRGEERRGEEREEERVASLDLLGSNREIRIDSRFLSGSPLLCAPGSPVITSINRKALKTNLLLRSSVPIPTFLTHIRERAWPTIPYYWSGQR
jgi:hypothetical protein